MQGRAWLVQACIFSRPYFVATFSPLLSPSSKCYSSPSTVLTFHAMALNFVKSKFEVFGLSHFLCIPITTAHSRAQLEQTLHQFKNDPTTSKIPAGAYRPLQTLNISIEVLSLPTADRVAAACHHLRSLDIDGLLRRASKGAPGNTHGVHEVQQRTPPVNQESRTSVSATGSGSPSLTVKLSGIRSNSRLGRRAPDQGITGWSLRTSYTDSTSRLSPFLDEIRRAFRAAGFQTPGLRPEINHGHIKLLSTKHASSRPKTLVRSPKEPSKFQRPEVPRFETRNIIQKFENFVFVEDIRLERLSLCELGLGKQIERFGAEAQLSEVCSVPLP